MKRFSVVVLIINAALLGSVAQQLSAQDVVDPGGGVIVDPGGVLPGRGPSFTLGFRGDDILIPRPGQPQAASSPKAFSARPRAAAPARPELPLQRPKLLSEPGGGIGLLERLILPLLPLLLPLLTLL